MSESSRFFSEFARNAALSRISILDSGERQSGRAAVAEIWMPRQSQRTERQSGRVVVAGIRKPGQSKWAKRQSGRVAVARIRITGQSEADKRQSGRGKMVG